MGLFTRVGMLASNQLLLKEILRMLGKKTSGEDHFPKFFANFFFPFSDFSLELVFNHKSLEYLEWLGKSRIF